MSETTNKGGVWGTVFAIFAVLVVIGMLRGEPDRQEVVDMMAKRKQREMEEARVEQQLETDAAVKAVIEDMKKHPNLYPR